MQSNEFVKLVARVCVATAARHAQSWDKDRHFYHRQWYDCINASIEEICPDITGPELSLMQMCANGGFAGEFCEWATEVVKGE